MSKKVGQNLAISTLAIACACQVLFYAGSTLCLKVLPRTIKTISFVVICILRTAVIPKFKLRNQLES